MDIKKLLKKINKIQLLAESFKEQERISAIERDLLKDYIRALYEEVLREDCEKEAPLIVIDEPVTVGEIKREEGFKYRSVSDDLQKNEAEKPVFEPMVNSEIKRPNTPSGDFELEKLSGLQVSDEKSGQQKKYEKAQSSTDSGSHTISKNMERIFAEEKVVELSEKLSRTKVDDILKTMGINERMFTIAELFANNQTEFMETISKINNAQDFQEAREILVSTVASKYQWDADDRWKKAQQFVKNVRRKFVS